MRRRAGTPTSRGGGDEEGSATDSEKQQAVG